MMSREQFLELEVEKLQLLIETGKHLVSRTKYLCEVKYKGKDYLHLSLYKEHLPVDTDGVRGCLRCGKIFEST
jgi:hypothetical protein